MRSKRTQDEYGLHHLLVDCLASVSKESAARCICKNGEWLRATRGDVPKETPVKSAFSYRREQLGSEILQELFIQVAGPKASEQTPGAFWKGVRLLAIDGTVESVADTESNRETFRYSTDDERIHSPFPQARLLLLVECATHLICDAESSSCRQAEANGLRLMLERWRLEKSLVLWDSGFHSSTAIFAVRARGGHVLGRLACNILMNLVIPFFPLLLDELFLFEQYGGVPTPITPVRQQDPPCPCPPITPDLI